MFRGSILHTIVASSGVDLNSAQLGAVDKWSTVPSVGDDKKSPAVLIITVVISVIIAI